MSGQQTWKEKLISWGIVLGIPLALLLIFALQIAWVYWYGWAWYLLVWVAYFNLHYLLEKMHWNKMYLWLEYVQVLALLFFGLGFYFRWFSNEVEHLARPYLRKLKFIGVLTCIGVSWLNWTNAPLLACLNLLMLGANLLVRFDLYLYYRLVNLDYFSFNLWFRQPSPLLKREVVWVIEDMLQKSPKMYKYKEKIYDFLVEYLKQYSHPFYHPKGAQKTDLEDFVWGLLANPKLPADQITLPLYLILNLLSNQNWFEKLVHKSQDNPFLKNWLAYMLKEWVDFCEVFVGNPKHRLIWFFKSPQLEPLLENYLQNLLPLLKNSPEYSEKFAYACSMSFVGIGIAKNINT